MVSLRLSKDLHRFLMILLMLCQDFLGFALLLLRFSYGLHGFALSERGGGNTTILKEKNMSGLLRFP